jgi:hypothetical protein
MNLPYDPANGPRFWDAISKLDGYPHGERMPIKHMLFESDALFKTSRILESVGADKSNPLIAVMDQTTMQREDESLKPLVLRALLIDGWQIKPLVMLPDKSGQVHTEMPRIKGVQARPPWTVCFPGHWDGCFTNWTTSIQQKISSNLYMASQLTTKL